MTYRLTAPFLVAESPSRLESLPQPVGGMASPPTHRVTILLPDGVKVGLDVPADGFILTAAFAAVFAPRARQAANEAAPRNAYPLTVAWMAGCVLE